MRRYPTIPYKDFAAVSLMCSSPHVLAVHPSVPAGTVKEFIALVKARPGQLSYGSAGRGTPAHLAGEMFKLAFGLDIIHVPFTGGGPAITSTLGGHTPAIMSALPTGAPYAKAGNVRALAMMSAKRSSLLPDVPTMAEATGTALEADIVTGLLAPAGTPREIIDLLHRSVAKIVAPPEFKERLASPRLRPGRQHARAFHRVDQGGNRQVGQSHPRRQYRRAVTIRGADQAAASANSAFCADGRSIGSRSSTIVPRPSVERMRMVPRCSSVSDFAIASPRPEP